MGACWPMLTAANSAGEAAVHLLGRMLAFDPGRRISAEEALCHEYFAALEASALNEMGTAPCPRLVHLRGQEHCITKAEACVPEPSSCNSG